MDAEANGETMLSSMVVHRDMNSANVSQFAAVSHPSQRLLPKVVQHQSAMSHPRLAKKGLMDAGLNYETPLSSMVKIHTTHNLPQYCIHS